MNKSTFWLKCGKYVIFSQVFVYRPIAWLDNRDDLKWQFWIYFTKSVGSKEPNVSKLVPLSHFMSLFYNHTNWASLLTWCVAGIQFTKPRLSQVSVKSNAQSSILCGFMLCVKKYCDFHLSYPAPNLFTFNKNTTIVYEPRLIYVDTHKNSNNFMKYVSICQSIWNWI